MASKRVNPPGTSSSSGKVDPHNAASDAKAGRGNAPPPFVATPAAKKGTNYEWEAALADALHIPYSANVKKFFDGWHSMEHSNASNNPFNISVDYTGKAIGTMQSSGPGATHVQDYKTPLDGIIGTAAFILRNDPTVAAALKAGNYQGASLALDSGHWAPADPGYGHKVYAAFQSGTYTIGNNAPVKLSPAARAQVATQAATLKAQSEAASAAYVQSTVDLAAQKQIAKQTLHIDDPWVTVVKDKNGITRFGTATGFNAPTNALSYGGMPLTKSELSSVWSSRYADIYEEFTGRVATPDVIAKILDGGYSAYGLQAALSGGGLQSWANFKNSPIYKKAAAGYQASAQNILGTNAPKSLLQQAFADGMDQTSFEQNLRTYKAPDGSHPYLNGPEFTNNFAAMQDTYKQIYGAPDTNATQSIKEAAGNGWTQTAFASYLRSQPEYTSSVEYQSNAMQLLDNLGLLFRQTPVLKPTQPGQQPQGGTPLPNSPLVPGAPKVLNPVLGMTASLQPVGSSNG